MVEERDRGVNKRQSKGGEEGRHDRWKGGGSGLQNAGCTFLSYVYNDSCRSYFANPG